MAFEYFKIFTFSLVSMLRCCFPVAYLFFCCCSWIAMEWFLFVKKTESVNQIENYPILKTFSYLNTFFSCRKLVKKTQFFLRFLVSILRSTYVIALTECCRNKIFHKKHKKCIHRMCENRLNCGYTRMGKRCFARSILVYTRYLFF